MEPIQTDQSSFNFFSWESGPRMLLMSSVAGRQCGPPNLVLNIFPVLVKKIKRFLCLYYPRIPMDIISRFIFPWIFFNVALSFMIWVIRSWYLPGIFLTPPQTPDLNPTHNPAATKVLPSLTVSLSSKGTWHIRGSEIFRSFCWPFYSSCLFGVFS